jgi:hypothetical protein
MNANARFHSGPLHHDPDHTIDRALSALRDAQPRPGLEGRILASLECRTAASQPARFQLSAHLALWTATSAAILAIASLVVLHQQTNRRATDAVILSQASQSHREANSSVAILSEASRRDAQSKDPDGASRPASNPELFSTTNLAQHSNTLSSRPEYRSEAAMRSGGTPVFENGAALQKSGCPTHEDKGETTTPTDAQLLADLHAPSHPAPPLPLTPQEKLFLRMLRYGNATQIAELNPMVRAKQDADETAAFKAFFPDPPPLQQSNGDTE